MEAPGYRKIKAANVIVLLTIFIFTPLWLTAASAKERNFPPGSAEERLVKAAIKFIKDNEDPANPTQADEELTAMLNKDANDGKKQLREETSWDLAHGGTTSIRIRVGLPATSKINSRIDTAEGFRQVKTLAQTLYHEWVHWKDRQKYNDDIYYSAQENWAACQPNWGEVEAYYKEVQLKLQWKLQREKELSQIPGYGPIYGPPTQEQLDRAVRLQREIAQLEKQIDDLVNNYIDPNREVNGDKKKSYEDNGNHIKGAFAGKTNQQKYDEVSSRLKDVKKIDPRETSQSIEDKIAAKVSEYRWWKNFWQKWRITPDYGWEIMLAVNEAGYPHTFVMNIPPSCLYQTTDVNATWLNHQFMQPWEALGDKVLSPVYEVSAPPGSAANPAYPAEVNLSYNKNLVSSRPFHLYRSHNLENHPLDSTFWEPLADETIDTNTGCIWAYSDNPFSLYVVMEQIPYSKAHDPTPADGDMLDKMTGILSWLPGDYSPAKTEQSLWFGTDPNNLVVKGNTNITGPDPCSGRFSYDAAAYETLNISQTYYWCVNEVNSHDANQYPGDKWRFDVQNYTILENFERYSDTGGLLPGLSYPASGSLRNTWIDGYRFSFGNPTAVNGGFAQLNTDTNDGIYDANSVTQGGAQSMKFYYDNDSDGKYEWLSLYGFAKPNCTVKYSEAMAAIDNNARLSKNPPWIQESLGLKRDWSAYKLLKISFYGNPLNTITSTDKLYVGLGNGNALGTIYTVQHPDPNILKQQGWHDWYVKLTDFSSQGLSLAAVSRICVGVGSRTSPQTGGKGAVFFDDIELLCCGVCIPGNVKGDLNNDCSVNASDIEILSNSWLGEKTALPAPIIDINATRVRNLGYGPLPLGPLTAWYNNGVGTGGFQGKFYDADVIDGSVPVVALVDGKKAVVFDTDDILVWMNDAGTSLILAPYTLTSDHSHPADANTFTVIYEVWNRDIDDQQWLLNWARRGEPDGTAAGFGYGFDTSWGCVNHWGEAYDMGFDVYVPPAHSWHTIGVTCDGKTETVAVDGIIQTVEEKQLSIHTNDPVTIGAGYLANANGWPSLGGHYSPDMGSRYTGAVASIKVYGDAIPPGNLALWTGSQSNLFADNRINFKDVAVLTNKWLIGPVLWPE